MAEQKIEKEKAIPVDMLGHQIPIDELEKSIDYYKKHVKRKRRQK